MPLPRLLTVAVVGVLLVGCGATDEAASPAPAVESGAAAPSAPAPPAGALTPPDATYLLRGKVTALPRPGASPPELVVQHEAIPSFADARNRVVGMDAMEMPFAVGPGVTLEGVEPGDPVEMRLEMRWDANPPASLAMVRELPADTPLQLSR